MLGPVLIKRSVGWLDCETPIGHPVPSSITVPNPLPRRAVCQSSKHLPSLSLSLSLRSASPWSPAF